MICPKCKSDQTMVTDSRQFELYRRRRYECIMCGERFTTKEIVYEAQKDLEG